MKILQQNSNRRKRVELWAKSIFLLRVIRKNPRSMYARVSKVMGQFVLKIEKLSHIMGANPNTRNGARLRSPSPIMAPVNNN